MPLTDAEAKAILANPTKWPERSSTKKWPIPGHKGRWMRLCPSPNAPALPYLRTAGAQTLTTNPDGMYAFVHHAHGFADVIAIEICCNNQNFNDKRARYAPTTATNQLVLPYNWLESSTTITKGRTKKRWDASGWFAAKPVTEVVLTVRHLRALFVLTDNDFNNFGLNNIPAGHEYFCRHDQLSQATSQVMQSFIKGLAMMKHFSTKPQ
ncbi:MAG TPA: hypothetical protein VIS99_10735 [Terrimicrobiaceae bacterium]